MNVNFRTIHAPCFPSLRDIQKSLPLRFDVLKLDKASFTLDTTTHSFYTVLDSLDKHQPSLTTLKNARDEGKLYDVNENGLEDKSQAPMPGDIVIEDRRPRREGHIVTQPQEEKYESFVYYFVETGSGKNNKSRAAYSLYGMKLRDAMRKKLDDFFGGSRIHQVKHLKIGMSDGILRLPEGLKLRIQELSVVDNSNAIINAILPVLDASSFPLKSLSVEAIRQRDPVFNNGILKSSEVLNIKNDQGFALSWADLLIILSNKTIHFKQQILLNDVVFLARHWVEHPRVIGTRFSMQSASVMKFLEQLQNELNATEVEIPNRKCALFPFCYTLPINSTFEFNIYGYKSPNHEEELSRGHRHPYMVVMEVMPVGSAQPIN